MKRKQEKKINYLDLVPKKNEELRWHSDHKERMILEVENRGVFHTIAQKFFGRPRFTKVHLDDMGTFVWPLIDGERTVADIAVFVKEKFGEKAEPLYPRIVKYFQIMESCHFIVFTNRNEG